MNPKIIGNKTMPSICLNMIVKNEAKNMPRLFQSVKNFITDYCIVDTGSTDDTIKVINDTFKDIPGFVISKPFVDLDFDFAHNRSKSLQIAQLLSNSDWILLLDADMELRVDGNLPPLDSNTMYSLAQRTGGQIVRNIRLIPRNLKYDYELPTHEHIYCTTPGHQTSDVLTQVWIQDHADGGCKADKFERDERLLRKYLAEKKPGDARALFYLGQTLMDLGHKRRGSAAQARATGKVEEADRLQKQGDQDLRDSIAFLQERQTKGGFSEEIYLAYSYIADMQKALGEVGNFVYTSLLGYDHSPQRPECLKRLGQFLLDQRKYRLASIVNDLLDKTVETKETFQMESTDPVKVKWDKILSKWYIAETRDMSIQMFLDMLQDPKHFRTCMADNMPHFITPEKFQLKIEQEEALSTTLKPKGWHCSNPSLTVFKGDLITNVRLVNYFFDLEKNCYIPDQPIKTENVIVPNHLLKNTISLQLPLVKDAAVKGFEDIRLFVFQDRLWGIATCREVAEDWLNKMILLSFIKKDDKTWNIEKATILESPFPGRCEKNWMPVPHPTEMRFLYSWDPLRVIRVDPETGKSSIVHEGSENRPYRGGSGLIPWGTDQWLGVIHESFDRSNRNHRLYLHRFVLLDANYKLIKVSNPFLFRKLSVEFCAGLAEHDGSIWLAYGYEDKVAYRCKVSKETIQNMLG